MCKRCGDPKCKKTGNLPRAQYSAILMGIICGAHEVSYWAEEGTTKCARSYEVCKEILEAVFGVGVTPPADATHEQITHLVQLALKRATEICGDVMV